MHQTSKFILKITYTGCVLFALQSISPVWAMPPDIQSPYAYGDPDAPYYDDTGSGGYPYPARPDYYQPNYGYPGYRSSGYPPQRRYAPRSYGYDYGPYSRPGYNQRGYGQRYYSQEQYPPYYGDIEPPVAHDAERGPGSQPHYPESTAKNTVPAGTATAGTTLTESGLAAQPVKPEVATATDPSRSLPAPAAGAEQSESLYDKAKGKMEDISKREDSATPGTTPAVVEPAAAVSTPDPAASLPAPAAGAEQSESLYDKAKGKMEDISKREDSATPGTTPAVVEPAAAVSTPDPAASLPAPAAGAEQSESLYDKAKDKMEDISKREDSATPGTTPAVDEPAAAVSTPDPAASLPAPAAGAEQSESLYDKARDKVKDVFKREDSATPGTTPAVDEPAAAVSTPDPAASLPAPAAGAEQSESLYDKARDKVKDVFKREDSATGTASAVDEPTAAVSTPAPAVDEHAAAVSTPAPAADPAASLPAPAAGPAEPKSIYDRATDKVKEIFKSDEAAAPAAAEPAP